MDYKFKTKPFEHQLEALRRSWNKKLFALFMEMGTGKTKVAIDNAALLYDKGHISGVLIVSKKGVYRNWTTKEIPEHMPEHVEYKMAYWTPTPNAKQREAMNSVFERDYRLSIFAMNIDAFSTDKGCAIAQKFLERHDAMMIVDDSPIRNRTAQRTKNLIKLGKLAKVKRLLNGTPITKSPIDLYTQCEFLDPDLLGYGSWYTFRNHFAVVVSKNFGGRKVDVIATDKDGRPQYRNLEELAEIIKPFSYRILKDECLDLPPKVYERHEVDMTPEQWQHYNDMKEYAITTASGVDISATLKLTMIGKLQQIACGFIRDEEGNVIRIKNNRLTELQELLEEIEGKVVIWCNHVPIIEDILAALPKEKTVHYYGATQDRDREAAKTRFQDPHSGVDYFVGNPMTAGRGLTLTAAKTVIFFSNGHDLEDRLQAEDRTHRIGSEQHMSITYIDLVCPGTVDEKVLTSHRSKIDVATTIMGDKYREWLL